MTQLRTARLSLEPLAPQHAAEMFPLLLDPAIYRYLDYGPPASVEALYDLYMRLQAGRSDDGSEVWLNWLLRLHAGHRKAIGYVQATVTPGSQAFVGYVVASSHWSHGYAAEAMTAMLEHLSTAHPVPVIRAVVEIDNARSIALLQRLGFQAVAFDQAGTSGLASSERLYARKATTRGAA